jgi:hypothetical protein
MWEIRKAVRVREKTATEKNCLHVWYEPHMWTVHVCTVDCTIPYNMPHM